MSDLVVNGILHYTKFKSNLSKTEKVTVNKQTDKQTTDYKRKIDFLQLHAIIISPVKFLIVHISLIEIKLLISLYYTLANGFIRWTLLVQDWASFAFRTEVPPHHQAQMIWALVSKNTQAGWDI